MTIKLTKKLPTEVGRYYLTYLPVDGLYVDIVEIDYSKEGTLIVDNLDYGYRPVIYFDGYHWAKVDQSMFEVVDDES